MIRIVTVIWFWLVTILPFSMLLTFILTLVVCNQILDNPRPNGRLPEISLLGVDAAYNYFLAGFITFFVQFLLLIIARLQFLFRSQSLIHPSILCAIHLIAFVSSIFLLIMAIMDVRNHPRPHIIGAIGMFAFLSAYCILDMVAAVYLFLKRAQAPVFKNIICPIWFLLCSLLLVIFFAVWGATSQPIPQYIAAITPLLYILGFIPYFWKQARKKERDADSPSPVHPQNELTDRF